jgi:ATP-dependent Clp protease protease subunit
MTIRKIPEIKALQRPDGLESLPNSDALARWDAGVRAADESAAETSISIYDAIGEDPWSGGGTTAKRIAGALRSIGARDVIVNINSPGGDLFEGIAIYNLLRAHEKKITVRVMGLAASAASIIAMAGDEIQIARAGFMMIHNCWVMAVGNRHDMREIADWLEPFDAAMADVYVARSGRAAKDIAKLMDEETWIGGKDAVDKGFADDFLPADQVKEDAAARAEVKDILAVRRVDALLAKQGIPRSERRSLIAGVKSGTPGAAGNATHDAGGLSDFAASLRKLHSQSTR